MDLHLTDGTIVLRSPTLDDLDAVVATVRSSIDRLAPWMVWMSPDYGPNEARAWIDRSADPTAIPLLIVGPDGDMIGSTGLNQVDPVNRRANLGYWIHTEATGNGYAAAATRLLARWAVTDGGFERIEILMSTRNEPSRRTAERAGATFECTAARRIRCGGEQHDAHCYVFLPDHFTEPGNASGPG